MNLKKWIKEVVCDFVGHTFGDNKPTLPMSYGDLKCKITLNRCDRCNKIVLFAEELTENEPDHLHIEGSLQESKELILHFKIDGKQQPIEVTESDDINNIEMEIVSEFSRSKWDLEAGKAIYNAGFVLGDLVNEIEATLNKTSKPKQVIVSSIIMAMIKEFRNGQMTSSLLRRMQRPILPGIIP